MSQKNSFFSFYPLSINLLIVKVKCFLHFFITVKIFRIFMCTAVVVAYINTIKTTFDFNFDLYIKELNSIDTIKQRSKEKLLSKKASL